MKYLLIKTENIKCHDDQHRTVEVNKWFNNSKELIDYLDSWGRDIENPLIFEAEQVKLTTHTVLTPVR